MSAQNKGTLRLKQTAAPMTAIASLERQLASAKAEIKALQRKLGRDGERPILHRKAFLRALEVSAKAENDKLRGTIALVSVTNLPELLENHGDLVADRLLTHIATTLAGHLRATDMVGRFGASSFAVYLAHAAEDAVKRKMEGLVAKLSSEPFTIGSLAIETALSHRIVAHEELHEPSFATKLPDPANEPGG